MMHPKNKTMIDLFAWLFKDKKRRYIVIFIIITLGIIAIALKNRTIL